jgi:hypothetical protein
MENYILVIVGLLILANIMISLTISKRDDFEISQKVAQITLVWLLPLIGGTGVWLLYKSIDKPIPKPESFAKRSEGSSSWQDTP